MGKGEGAGGRRALLSWVLVVAPTVVVVAVAGGVVGTMPDGADGRVRAATTICLAWAGLVALYETAQGSRLPSLTATLRPRWPRPGSAGLVVVLVAVPVGALRDWWDWPYGAAAVAVATLVWASSEVGKALFRLVALSSLVAVVVALGFLGAGSVTAKETVALGAARAQVGEVEGEALATQAEASGLAREAGEVAKAPSCARERPETSGVAEERKQLAERQQRLWCEVVGWRSVVRSFVQAEVDAAQAAVDVAATRAKAALDAVVAAVAAEVEAKDVVAVAVAAEARAVAPVPNEGAADPVTAAGQAADEARRVAARASEAREEAEAAARSATGEQAEMARVLVLRKADLARVEADLALAQEELAAAKASAAALPEGPPRVPAHELVAAGVDRVVDAVTPDAGEGVLAVVVGTVGLLGMGVLLVLGYRTLELRNNDRHGAPIAVEEITGDLGKEEGNTAEALTQRLRQKVFDAGDLEPGVIPGSSSGGHLAKLLQEAKGVPHNALAAAVVSFVEAVAFPPPGVKVATAVTRRAKGGGLEASVEISTRVSGRFVGGGVVEAENVVDLVDRVADFVATDSVNYSKVNPGWVKWQDGSGEALRCYREAQEKALAHPKGAAVESLVKCLRRSPGNALVRLALAHSYDLGGERLKALRLHLVTVADYPTLMKSRYRVATSLLMLSQPAEVEARWVGGEVDGAVRREVVDLLVGRYGRRRGTWSGVAIRADLVPRERAAPRADLARGELAGSGADLARREQEVVTRRLRLMAERELRTLRRELRWYRLVWVAAAPGERSERLRLARNGAERRLRSATYDTVWLGTYARLCLAGGGSSVRPPLRWRAFHSPRGFSPGSLGDWRRVVDRAAPFDPATPAAAHYNAACIYSDLITHFEATPARSTVGPGELEAVVDGGFRHLDAALRSGGPALFRRPWLDADPDLAALRARGDRFRALVDAYTPDPGDGGDGSAEAPAVEERSAWTRRWQLDLKAWRRRPGRYEALVQTYVPDP